MRAARERLEFLPDFHGFVAADLLGGQLAFRDRTAEFLVNFKIIKPAVNQRVLDGGGIVYGIDSRPPSGGSAHRTTFRAGIQNAPFQNMRPELGAGLSNRLHLPVTRRVATGDHAIESLADDFAGVAGERGDIGAVSVDAGTHD